MSARETAELLLMVGRLVQFEGYGGGLSPAQWMALRFLSPPTRFPALRPHCGISSHDPWHCITSHQGA